MYTDRINKLCELYDDLRDGNSIIVDVYRVYRDKRYFSFEEEDGLCIDRHRTHTINFTTKNPSEIQSEIESLLKYFEESHNLFVQK